MTRMSRAAILTCAGDPFVALLFLHFFKNVWSDEVDKLYFNYDGKGCDKKLCRYIEKRFREHPKVVWLNDVHVSMNIAINKCFDVCKEDLIVLMTDDTYIYKKGVLDNYFRMIENGESDFIGCVPIRHDYFLTNGILQFCIKKFNFDGFFDPCLAFLKRKDLMRTDRHYGDKHWKKGEYIKELDWTPENDEGIDALGWITIQLLAKKIKFHSILQCGLNHYDREGKKIGSIMERFKNILRNDSGWLHAISLHWGWVGTSHQHSSELAKMKGEDSMDYERRVVFWKIAANLEDYNKIKEYKKIYLNGIEKVIVNKRLNRDRIKLMLNSFKKILIFNDNDGNL